MLPIPQEYKSSICEIKTLENELIAAGIIREITDEYIEITAKSGTMDCCIHSLWGGIVQPRKPPGVVMLNKSRCAGSTRHELGLSPMSV